MNEIKVNPCANGTMCSATYDESDDTLVIFGSANEAMGFINTSEIRNSGKYRWHDLRENPEDLPDCWEEIVFETNRNHYVGEMRTNKKFYSASDEYDFGYDTSVLRWKYYGQAEEVGE